MTFDFLFDDDEVFIRQLKEMALTVVAAVTKYAKEKKDVDRVVGTCGRFTTEAVTDTGRVGRL